MGRRGLARDWLAPGPLVGGPVTRERPGRRPVTRERLARRPVTRERLARRPLTRERLGGRWRGAGNVTRSALPFAWPLACHCPNAIA